MRMLCARASGVVETWVGAFAGVGLEVATGLAAQGIESTVVDPRWALPVPDALVTFAAGSDHVVVIEDNIRAGGVGTALRSRLEDAGVVTPVMTFGMPAEFPVHASRTSTLTAAGLTGQSIARRVTERVAAPSLTGLSDLAAEPGA